MSVIKFVREFSTLFNWDTDENPTTEQDYQNAVKNWTETEMNIVDTLLWQPTTEYATGNIVKTPSLPSQYVLRCAEAGTSGSAEPDYSGASVGDTVTDGSVEWVIVNLATGNAADVDAGNIGVNAEVDNSEAWASAIGGGAIAEDDERLVKGSTVYAVTSVMETNIATNTEAIEENTENIATNTENIAQNTTDIDIADKRISNIEKLLQGNLYDYQADTDSKYVKTIPQGAMPYASIDSVGGRTVVMNQFIQNGDFSADSGWTYSTGTTHTITDGVATIVGAVDNYFAIYLQTSRAFNVWAGHKYLISAVVSNDIGRVVLVPTGSTTGGYKTFNDVSTPTRISWIYTPASDGSVRMYCRFHNATVGTEQTVTGTISNYMCIDLTLMFGSGNEPTIDEFKVMFPAQYYQYSQGSLLSAGVTEVVSKKADTTTIATYPIPAEIQALEGYGWSAGSVYNYIDYERKVFVKCVDKIVLDGTQTLTANWRADSTGVGWYYQYNLTQHALPVDNFTLANIVSDKLLAQTYSDLYTYNVGIGINPSTSYGIFVWQNDTSLTNATAINNYLSANPITVYYELATPVETDISAYLTDDNLIEVEAGGTLTFENQHGDDYRIDVPSSETYMVDLQEAI